MPDEKPEEKKVVQKTVFEKTLNSISKEGQKLIPMEEGSMLVLRIVDKAEAPTVKLYPIDKGNAVVIENVLGKSKPMESLFLIQKSLRMNGVKLDKAYEIEGPKEVPDTLKQINRLKIRR